MIAISFGFKRKLHRQLGTIFDLSRGRYVIGMSGLWLKIVPNARETVTDNPFPVKISSMSEKSKYIP